MFLEDNKTSARPRHRISYYEKIHNMYRNHTITKEKCDELCAKHNKQLEKRRKYIPGEPITSFEELLSQTLVWMFGGPRHRSFVISQQLNTVISQLYSGNIKKCVKK